MLKAEDLKIGKSYRFYNSYNGERARHYRIGKVLRKYKTYILFEISADTQNEPVLGKPHTYMETVLNCDIGLGEHPIVFFEK